MTRAHCGSCDRVVAMRQDGTLRLHRNEYGEGCAGAHQPPEAPPLATSDLPDAEVVQADERAIKRQSLRLAASFDPALFDPGVITDRNILESIRDGWTQNGYGPTLREIAPACGFASTGGIAHRLRRLVRDGLVISEHHVPRSLRLTSAGVAALEGSCPLIPVRIDAKTGVIHILREDAS